MNARAELAALLKERFPWLGTAEGDATPYPSSGADVIEALEMLYRELEGHETPAPDLDPDPIVNGGFPWKGSR